MKPWKWMQWATRWLERHGLGNVADTLDSRSASVGDVEAMHNLARRGLARGEPETAVPHLLAAITESPKDATLFCTLGAAYRQMGEFNDSRNAYEQALQLNPCYLQVLSNLGEWCIAQGRNDEALDWFDKALQIGPNFFEARLNKTAALFELARYKDALVLAEQLVKLEPSRAEAHLNLGNLLVHTGKAKQGIKHYKKALELQPAYPEAHYNMASLLGSKADMVNTIAYLERRIKERGDSVQNLGMLAAAHQAAGNLQKSEDYCHRVLMRQPDNIASLVTLGSCLSNSGNASAALELYERVIQLDPTQATMGSNILFEYNNVATLDRDSMFLRHKKWANQFETGLLRTDSFNGRSRDPTRKLRIGYVSGDFVRHPVGFLLQDILRHHHADEYEVHCFSMVIRPEEVLPELRKAAYKWEDIFYLTDEELTNLIQVNDIDILVDLSGHTAAHRLLVFAGRPAPVQVEWIGYFHSTGMVSIDYFITDPFTSPTGSGQQFSETPVFLPRTRFCYGPPDYAPLVGSPPFVKNGFLTFGSFNRLPKLTEEIVSAWSQILRAVKGSRLVIKSGSLKEPVVEERLLGRFAHHGIAPERLDLREGSSHQDMLAEYGDLDIALDTFPFNGGMTTLEALWMGVPVVTIAGDTVVSRQTVSALANLDLADELAFANVDSYVEGAIALAANPVRLAELRSQLRPRMEASPLRQSEQFTRDLEALYRRMWFAWCEGRKLESDVAPVASK